MEERVKIDYHGYITAALMMVSYWVGKVVGYEEIKKDIFEWIQSGELEEDINIKKKLDVN